MVTEGNTHIAINNAMSINISNGREETADAVKEQDDTVSVQATLNGGTWREVKSLAVRRGLTNAELMNEALVMWKEREASASL